LTDQRSSLSSDSPGLAIVRLIVGLIVGCFIIMSKVIWESRDDLSGMYSPVRLDDVYARKSNVGVTSGSNGVAEEFFHACRGEIILGEASLDLRLKDTDMNLPSYTFVAFGRTA